MEAAQSEFEQAQSEMEAAQIGLEPAPSRLEAAPTSILRIFGFLGDCLGCGTRILEFSDSVGSYSWVFEIF